MDRKLAAILAADVVGYSTHMERDEQGTFERLRAGRTELFEPEIARHHGRIFKLMGDGLLAEFASVVDAVECAVSLQRGLAERNGDLPEEHRIHVRIGINLGEVIVEGDDRFGEGVNIATRLEQLAEPDAIYVSGKVAKEVEKKLAFGFEPMGHQRVKNIAEPVPIYRVRLSGQRASSSRRWILTAQTHRMAASASLVLLGLLIVTWWYFTPSEIASISRSGQPTVAVLAFDNLSGNPDLDYLGEGISEDLISMLAQSPDLSVIARNSSFTFKGTPTDVRKIGAELNADYVLEGSVRRDADKFRVVAQLIDAKTGDHIWANSFDETGSDPFLIQDAITHKIVSSLAGDRGQIRRSLYDDVWQKDSASLGEYDYYIRGHSLFFKYTSKDVGEAIRIWEEGLAKYPQSALLKFKLGFAHYVNIIYGWSQDIEGEMERVREYARSGKENASLSPLEAKLAHWLFAYVHLMTREFAPALREAEAAVARAPSDAFMLPALGDAATSNREYEKALTWIDYGIENDPFNKQLYSAWKGWTLTAAERYQESVSAMNEAGDFYDAIPLTRAINFIQLGDEQGARSQVKKALELNPHSSIAYYRSSSFLPPEVLDRQIADLRKAGLPEG